MRATTERASRSGRALVFFDGACPICAQEISYLRKLDRHERLLFEDLTLPGTNYPVRREDLLRYFHVQDPDGRILRGAPAFALAWGMALGWPIVTGLSRSRVFAALVNPLYELFLLFRPFLQQLARRAT